MLFRSEGLLENVEVTPAEIAEELLKSGGTDVVLGGLVKFLKKKTIQKAKAAELKELLKSDDNTDVDVEGFVKFLKQKKLENAKATEAEQLLTSGEIVLKECLLMKKILWKYLSLVRHMIMLCSLQIKVKYIE